MPDGILRFKEEQVSTEATVQKPSQAESATEAASPRRYDQQTVQKALALAIELQQEHRDTLTSEEVISIGEEANVDSEFVLKALALLDAEQMAAARGSGLIKPARQKINRKSIVDAPSRLRRLPRWAKLVSGGVPAVFTLLALLIFQDSELGLRGPGRSVSLSMLLLFGPLLAFVMGLVLRSKRLAFCTGFSLGLGLILAVAATGNGGTPNSDMSGFFCAVLIFALGGGALGTTAAVVRKRGLRVCRRTVSSILRRFPELADD